MRILIVEDDSRKCEIVSQLILDVDRDAKIVACTNLSDSVQALNRITFDVIVLDLMLPFTQAGTPLDAGVELLRLAGASKLNGHTQIVALTAFEELYQGQEERFARAGVLLVYFEEESDGWQRTLRSIVKRAFVHQRSEFVIVCALEDERDGFTSTCAVVGPHAVENGFDVRSIEIDELGGRLILLPREGLVSAAVIGSIAVERYRPQILAMSGICAGVRDRTELGQVLVCGNSWEYQVGKFSGEGFLSEPYQMAIPESLRMKLASVCRSERVLAAMYEGVERSKINPVNPKIANIVSGSAVLADAKVRDGIMRQHRKIDGFEMEVASIFRAAALLDPATMVIAAKTVVDFADESKDDDVRHEGCRISARFLVEAIGRVMSG